MRSSVAKACRRSRRQRSTVIALLLTCALVLALGGAQAQAAPKGVVDFFGGTGTGAGQFSTPSGVAVNGSTGHLYVVDSGNHRVQEFDVFGNFVRAWGYGVATGTATFEVCNAPAPCLAGISGADAGQLANPQGIAVDQVSGAVYVTNQDNGRIEKFDSSGNFLFAFGWGVDTGAAAVETCTTASACQAAASGSDAGQFATTFSGHVAVDPRNGDVVVADPANGRVQKFDSSGAFLFAFGWGVDTGAAALQTCTTASTCQAGTTGSGAGQFDFAQPTRVAVDSSGSVYTVEGGNNRRVQKFNATASSAAVFAPEHTSGTDDPATAPTDVAVDPGNDHVLVAKDQQVLELDIAGGLVETHAVGAGLPAANGMAVDGSSNRIYLSTTPDQRIYVLGAITPPSATISPVTDVAAESATFNGTVNPNGGGKLSTGYHFEYSDDAGATWTPVPTPDADAGNGTSDVPVSQAATGLEPNTDYRVRLVASRPFAGGSATSAEATFTTDAAPPTVSGVGSSEITDTTAVLGGRIDPNHSQTTYQFEYGTDTSYGNATPVDSAGSGARSVAVSKKITGLQPNTTYHFRLVATNVDAGEAQGTDNTFTTDANPPQPSGRAYEMVSPVDKNGGDISRDVSTGSQLNVQTGAAASGDAVAFVSRSNFADPEAGSGGLGIPNYLARRGGDGWITEGVTPPVGRVFPDGSPEVPRVPGLALDASRSFGVSGALLTPEAERLNGSFGLYMRTAGQTAGQRYTLISVPSDTLAPDTTTNAAPQRFEWEASTPDGRHVVFSSSRRLLPGARPDSAPSRPGGVYEWVDGSLRLASVLPPGLSFLAANPTAFGGGGTVLMSSGNLHGDNVISDDGRRLFFTANVQGAGRVLLVREDGAATRVVSASERPGDPPSAPRAGAFWTAKRTDGSVAFFTSGALLTADAVIAPGGGSMLYRWDANAPEGQRLSAISPDPLGQPGVQGPAAVSDDATSVYFVASGELAPGATRGAQNLYVWRQGQGLGFVATLDGTDPALTGALDGPLWRTVWTRLGGRGARVSADGERLLFASYAQLDPAYDTVEESAEDCGDPDVAGDRCRQIYLYDAPSGRVSCLTCVAGAPVTGDANLFGNSDGRRPVGDNSQETVDAPLDLPHNLSADGRRAFFETARPLVTADENNAIDVYEWEDGDPDGEGELRLISSGRDATDSKFLAASLSGDDVFFTSRDRLVGIDTDNHVDLYDARIAGGFAAQNPSAPPPPCEGDDCQGTLSGAPFLPGVGSGGVTHGNLDPGPRPTFSVARLSREQQAQLARGRRVPVRVRVNRAGKVRLAARAKLGGRMRTVATASKTARKAGSLTLGVKLTRAALGELTRKGKLKVTLAVKFAGVREARNSTVRLRRARGAGERRPR